MALSQLTSRHRPSRNHLRDGLVPRDFDDKKTRTFRRYLYQHTLVMIRITKSYLWVVFLSLLFVYAVFLSITSIVRWNEPLATGRGHLKASHWRSHPVTNGILSTTEQEQEHTCQPPFGFVMRDFARRVLSRHIVNSNILVVGSDATTAAKYAHSRNHTDNPYDTTDYQSHYSIGGTFAMHAIAEGHSLHAIDYGANETATIDDWWLSFQNPLSASEHNNRWWSSTHSRSRPGWLLAAVFDLGFGYQDRLWDQSTKFLSESTVTYAILAMHSQLLPDDSLVMDGLVAAEALLGRRYKLQVLLVSHYDAGTDNKDAMFESYGPNGLLGSIENIKEFLQWGAEAAVRHGRRLPDERGVPFTAYIFATQGLDLAIPSSRVYLSEESRLHGDESKTQVNLYKPLQFKPCRQAQLYPQINVSFDTWRNESVIMVSLPANDTSQRRMYHRKAPTVPGFSYISPSKEKEKVKGPRPEAATLWYDADTIGESEAACLRMGNRSRCTTRIVPGDTPKEIRDERPNILLLLIDPMSRGLFERSMPETRQTLNELGFVHFPNYTVVGGNSGPNQAALYSGIPLTNRDGIRNDAKRIWLWDRLRTTGYKTLKSEDGCIENSNMLQSLKPNTTHGEALTKLFCFDFDRPNCIGPDLASTLLLQYGEQFLKAYEGVAPTAGFIHFVDTHEDTMILSGLLDSQISDFFDRMNREKMFENTVVVLCSDHGLHYGPYFQAHGGRKERSQPLLYMRIPPSLESHHNLATFKRNAGLWTTAFDLHETILSLTGIRSEGAQFDRGYRPGASLFEPLPSQRDTCKNTVEIPEEYCALYEPDRSKSLPRHRQCKRLLTPPSVLSFFADIPLAKRSKMNMTCGGLSERPPSTPSFFQECECATSHRMWYKCSEHPWGSRTIHSLNYPEEHFALMKCRGQKLSLDTRVIRQANLATRSFRKLQFSSQRKRNLPPNILLIEVDSVSVAYADRHFPLTRKFLKDHRLEKDVSAGGFRCHDDVCAADFTMFGLVGPNSIANQIPELSGCLVSRFHESCFESHTTESLDACSEGGMFRSTADGNCKRCPNGTFLIDPLMSCSGDGSSCCTEKYAGFNSTRICHDTSRLENDLQLFRRGPYRHNTFCPDGDSNPFIFEVAKESGYITFFGEETCYEDSIDVPQNNIFPLEPDIELQNVYCRAQERLTGPAIGELINACAAKRTLTGETLNPGFDHIAGIFDSYQDVPKFAFMNAVAAPDYSPSSMDMISYSEEYDAQLAKFLESMTSRDDFSNTVIVLRGDHRLQGGSATLEYSLQVEHRDPWTQIILPKNMEGRVSLEALFENQNKLATGFDLYRTIRELMGSGKTTSASEPAIPDWSLNLLQTMIPDGRTCRDAKIPVDFCPCEEEAPDRPPNFGVCNSFDSYGDGFCRG